MSTPPAGYPAAHEQVRAYLDATGWHLLPGPRQVVEVYARDRDGHRAVVRLPVAPYDDYPEQIASVLDQLARVEARALDVVRASVQLLRFDCVSGRAETPDTRDGTISALDGESLVRNTVQAAIQAAWTTIRPRLTAAGPPPPMVREFARAIRLGQTQVGSYVVTVFVPLTLPSENVGMAALRPATGFPRRAIETFGRALHLTRDVLSNESEPTSSVVAELVAQGVSSNLLQAVALAAPPAVDSLEFSIAWSAAHPSHHAPSKVAFDARLVQRAAETAALLKAKDDPRRQTFVGWVTNLGRPGAPRVGAIELTVTEAGKVKHVRVSLEGKDHEKATRAIDEHKFLLVTGLLVRKGRFRWLLDPSNVDVIEPSSEPIEGVADTAEQLDLLLEPGRGDDDD
jgi:hypothetical protein